MACLEIPTAVVLEENSMLKEILTSFMTSTEKAIFIRTEIQFTSTAMTEVSHIKAATTEANTPDMTSTTGKMMIEDTQKSTTNVTEEAVF